MGFNTRWVKKQTNKNVKIQKQSKKCVRLLESSLYPTKLFNDQRMWNGGTTSSESERETCHGLKLLRSRFVLGIETLNYAKIRDKQLEFIHGT